MKYSLHIKPKALTGYAVALAGAINGNILQNHK